MQYSKLQIAETQLEQALRLFEEGDFLSAITLAGAAEEILGRLLEADGRPSAYSDMKRTTADIHKRMFDSEANEKKLSEILNGIRNGLKHLGSGEKMEFEAEEYAVDILDRAVSNYFFLTGKESARMENFNKRLIKCSYPMSDA